MEILRCRRRIIELKGKKGEKGMLKLIDQPEGMQCLLITQIPDSKTLYLKNSVGIVSLNIKDSYMLTNSSADDIKAVAVVCNENICLTGGDDIDWAPHIKKTSEKKEEPKRITKAKEYLEKEAKVEKLKVNDSQNKKPVNNDMNDMLLKMLPHLLKNNGEKDNQDMSKLFSMMEMLNGKNNMDTGVVENMMSLMSDDAQKKHVDQNSDKKSEENHDQEKHRQENISDDKLSKVEFDEDKHLEQKKEQIEEKLEEEDILNEEKLKEIKEEKSNEYDQQNEKENIEEIEEFEGADYCDLNMFEWEKVEYPFPRTGHYISGSAIIRGLKAYATGIPGEFSYKPPPWQGEFNRFFNYLGQGYWVRIVTQRKKD